MVSTTQPSLTPGGRTPLGAGGPHFSPFGSARPSQRRKKKGTGGGGVLVWHLPQGVLGVPGVPRYLSSLGVTVASWCWGRGRGLCSAQGGPPTSPDAGGVLRVFGVPMAFPGALEVTPFYIQTPSQFPGFSGCLGVPQCVLSVLEVLQSFQSGGAGGSSGVPPSMSMPPQCPRALGESSGCPWCLGERWGCPWYPRCLSGVPMVSLVPMEGIPKVSSCLGEFSMVSRVRRSPQHSWCLGGCPHSLQGTLGVSPWCPWCPGRGCPRSPGV